MVSVFIAFAAALLLFISLATFIISSIRIDRKANAKLAELTKWHEDNKASIAEAESKVKPANTKS